MYKTNDVLNFIHENNPPPPPHIPDNYKNHLVSYLDKYIRFETKMMDLEFLGHIYRNCFTLVQDNSSTLLPYK
jgi:hypothetical protein